MRDGNGQALVHQRREESVAAKGNGVLRAASVRQVTQRSGCEE